MTSGFPISTGRLAASLNHERRRRRSKDDTDIGVDVATPEPRKANLRRSALASNATEAQEISTLDNADLDTIICAVARVVYQYTVRNDSVRIGKSEAPSSTQQALDLFDEARHPLDDSGAWTAVPSVGTIEDFLYDVQEGLQLDATCIVTALVMLERAVYGSSLVVAPRTWRVQGMPCSRRVSIRDAFAERGEVPPASYCKNQTRSHGGCPTTRTVEAQSFTVCAGHALTWCGPDGQTVRVMTARDSSVLMGFPSSWRLPKGSRASQRAVGNAVCVALSKAITLAAIAVLNGDDAVVATPPTPIKKRAIAEVSRGEFDALRRRMDTLEERVAPCKEKPLRC